MTYAFTLSNMAFKKIHSDLSDESLNIAINYLCQGSHNKHELIYF